MSISEVFQEAATYLSEHGHHKGNLRGPGGTVCAIGAISGVTIGDLAQIRPGFDEACTIAGATLKNRFPELGMTPNRFGITMHPLAEWNDLPSTTGEDVILLFKELAHEDGERQ